MRTNSRNPLMVHPGEILDHEFLRPKGLDSDALAQAIGVDAGNVKSIVDGRQGISREMATLLAGQFGTTVKFWVNLQHQYEGRVKGKGRRGGAEFSGDSVEEQE